MGKGMTDEEAWRLERRCWGEGTAYYRAILAPRAVMAFESGILVGRDILAALERAPRWQSFELSAQTVVRPVAGLVVLAYRAMAHRPEQDPYAAWCTSTWMLAPGQPADGTAGWRLVQHQQTPA